MGLLRAFLMAAGLACASAQALQQTPVSITKPEGKTVLINCHVSDPDFNNLFIHWYQKRPNAAPRRIAYMASRLFLQDQSDEGKFSIEKDPTKSVCTLTVSKVTRQDAATYYCARWDAQQCTSASQTVSSIRYQEADQDGPERILYIGSGAAVYDDNSYRSKYGASKEGTNLCTLQVDDISSRDEGTYYCAFWQSHRAPRAPAACTGSCRYPERRLSVQRREPPSPLPASKHPEGSVLSVSGETTGRGNRTEMQRATSQLVKRAGLGKRSIPVGDGSESWIIH
ncbi:PREDICTED: uncharacterized protein LOC104508203 [Eurypyga helias]|uniref:uncharacterized protein LOC104508203 n=1 Tax=Eurypyga helias TaxID=54383 RepID=UPI00052935FC|nr:PREDICTED: uncharacterized protein LOC104508203 [Eurypyga helias]